MNDESTRSLYQAQRAPKQALPTALARFSATRVRRPAYALPALATTLLLALWLMLSMQDKAPAGDMRQQIALIPTTGMAGLSLPSRPDMPTLAQVNVPSGNLAIPRLNQITTKPTRREIQ